MYGAMRKLQFFNKRTDVERNYMLFIGYNSIIYIRCTEQCVFLQSFFLMNIFIYFNYKY